MQLQQSEPQQLEMVPEISHLEHPEQFLFQQMNFVWIPVIHCMHLIMQTEGII